MLKHIRRLFTGDTEKPQQDPPHEVLNRLLRLYRMRELYTVPEDRAKHHVDDSPQARPRNL